MNTPVYARLDLDTGAVDMLNISEDYFRKYVGGKILAARLLLDFNPAGVGSLATEAVIIVNTGPANGTGAPSTSRFNVSFKNVLTGGIASSNCGGTFGLMMKKAGFDGIIISGKAKKPCRIDIIDGEVKLLDAGHLWGMGTERVQRELPAHYGKLVIGPAGENLVRFASAASGERMAGRCGIGAVLGSKNIKAITAYGTKKAKIEQPEKLGKYLSKWIAFIKKHPMTGDALPHYGSAGLVHKANANYALPTRNFKYGHCDDADAVSGETLAETRLVRNANCISCPIRCERRVMLDGREVKGPEYETLGFFGPNMQSGDLDAVIRLNFICDVLGMDTISAASTLAFAMELQENGVADFGVQFGKLDNLEEVLNKIARREGVYSDLANGSKWLSEKYGGKEYAIHAKGLELASYEPRRSIGMGLGYATSNRGGCHLNGGYLALLESVGVLTTNAQKPNGKAALTVFMQNALEAVSAGGFCLFSAQTFIPAIFFRLGPNHWLTRATGNVLTHSGPVVRLLLKFCGALRINALMLLPHAKALRLITGIPLSTGPFLRLGERGYNLERMYNNREGLGKKDDSLPDRLTKDLQDESKPNTFVPLDDMLPQYYSIRGWDEEGRPTRRKLSKLGIEL